MSFALRRNKTTNDTTTSDTPDTESKIRIRTIETIDVTVMIGSAISAFALSQLLYETILPLSGALGFLLTCYVFFIAISWLAVREIRGTVRAKDHLARLVV